MLCILLAACVGAYPEPFASPDVWIPGYPDDAVLYYVRPPSMPVITVSTQCIDNQTMYFTDTSLEKGDKIGPLIYDINNQTLLYNQLIKISKSAAGNFSLAMEGNCSGGTNSTQKWWKYNETDWPENTYLRHIVDDADGTDWWIIITPSTGKWEKWFWPLVGLVVCAFIFAIIGWYCPPAIRGKIKNCCKIKTTESGLGQILL